MLKDHINADLKEAMRGGDNRRRDALRLLTAALKQKEVDERKTLVDSDVVSVIDKMIKQRRESIAQFDKGGRADLAAKEKSELDILSAYLPAQMGDAEIQKEIEAVVAETGASGAKDMGKVMGALKTKIAGKADMSRVSALVKAKLSA